ncbi:amino acid ABC transporter permease [Halalkalibacter akibai]|uniref:Glutamate Aspartate transport system permease protein GltJ n=1 Tax=Halalkalibacter akibai (strain ATCC 43226 / DSM 21942 / CIP 109018 / JCM 9157 / 1139) TaxID=1236973 RepID=W4QSP0_HALA3|nr:ABC transporter permease subunit [Halalkalibacter akibai]GAE34354.1 glutamate Aspartate transport system permease protein GltJ [Halalkalibacter akibai JCM 9157]
MENKVLKETVPFWRNIKVIHFFLQIIFLSLLIGVFYILIQNAIAGLNRAGIKFGFQFLNATASFPIGEKFLQYSPTDSYSRALIVGFSNTLKVTIIGIILTTILGVVMGIARLSSNWLARTVSGLYVEIFRNTPVLVQIFIWYFAIFLPLPRIQEATHFAGAIISNRGLVFPWFDLHTSSIIWFIIMVFALFATIGVWRWMVKRRIETGEKKFPVLWGIGLFLLFAIVAFAITGRPPVTASLPVVDGMQVLGGLRFTPEFSAILFGLVFYTASYITEIVRGGILAVSKGQLEAANALGLSKFSTLSFVIFPQAIRTIIPPVTSQYLNLAKNSSLAVAVGYPDLFSVGNTVLNQSGRAIEVIIIMLIAYLTISLITAIIMNIYNNATKLVER